MAEAFGVAGNVISIVSLGIQITQGLLKYYGSWKDQDNDISNMCASLDSLSETLKILSKTIQPPARFDDTTKDSVEKNVNRIDGAVGKLKGELGKIQDTESIQSGVRSTMRRHVRRALYPFREETLGKIHRFVSEARQNLDLALLVLQVFVCYQYCYARIKLIWMSSQSISDIHHEVTFLVRKQEGIACFNPFWAISEPL
jgi:hypothetical protein